MGRNWGVRLGPPPGRDTLVLGAYEPDALTTGVLPGTSLETSTGDIIITASGTLLENLDISGFVDIRASNVTIRNCRIRGSSGGTSNRGLINCTHANCFAATIVDCTLVPDTPSYWLNAIHGHEYTIRRCNAYNVVDACGVFPLASDPGGPTNVVIEQNYFHDLSYFSPDPNHGDDQTHNDVIQLQGGSGTVIRGNSLKGLLSTEPGVGTTPLPRDYALSVLMFNNNVGNITDCIIEDNWARGGEIGFNGGGLTGGQDLGRIWRNKFDHSQGLQGSGGDNTWTIGLDSSVTCDTGDGTANKNVYFDSGNEVTVRRNA
jgi:hypothetical protein